MRSGLLLEFSRGECLERRFSLVIYLILLQFYLLIASPPIFLCVETRNFQLLAIIFSFIIAIIKNRACGNSASGWFLNRKKARKRGVSNIKILWGKRCRDLRGRDSNAELRSPHSLLLSLGNQRKQEERKPLRGALLSIPTWHIAGESPCCQAAPVYSQRT